MPIQFACNSFAFAWLTKRPTRGEHIHAWLVAATTCIWSANASHHSSEMLHINNSHACTVFGSAYLAEVIAVLRGRFFRNVLLPKLGFELLKGGLQTLHSEKCVLIEQQAVSAAPVELRFSVLIRHVHWQPRRVRTHTVM